MAPALPPPTPASARDRLVAAACEVILAVGVQDTTHRRVAHQAGVSLGTLTYHFASLDALVAEAFQQMIDRVAGVYHDRLSQATGVAQAREAVVDLICGDLWATPRQMLLNFELYALILRHPQYRPLMDGWMRRSRQALRLHFSEPAAVVLDALLEGFTIHLALGSHTIPRERILAAVAAVTANEG